MVLSEFYRDYADDLRHRGFENPETEARFLLKGLLGISDTDFYLNPDRVIKEDEFFKLCDAANKRISGTPLQYILGQWDFMDSTFHVGYGVLIPRPETELLCQCVIDSLEGKKNPVIYDLCSGSGCIGISLKKFIPEADVYLVEKSCDALKYLYKNVEDICGDNSPVVIHGDVLNYSMFEEYPQADVIVSNPPYISTNQISSLQKEIIYHEPIMALDGGSDGLLFYRYIINNWKDKLKTCGVFFFEIGEEQGSAVGNILTDNGFDSLIKVDYNNHDRIVIGRKITDVV